MLANELSNRNAGIACGLTKYTPEFLCVIVSPNGDMDVFVFDASGTGSISGKYEYCPAGTSSTACGNDLLLSPDGTVSGIVVRNSSATGFDAGAGSMGGVLYDGILQMERKNSSKMNSLSSEMMNSITEMPAPEAFQKIEDAIENIRRNAR
jgi:hypothetical protein